MPFQSVVSHTVQLLLKVLKKERKHSAQLHQVDIHNKLFHENHLIVHLGAFNQFPLSKNHHNNLLSQHTQKKTTPIEMLFTSLY